MALVYPKPEKLYHSLSLLSFGYAFQEFEIAYNNFKLFRIHGDTQINEIFGDIVYARKLAEEAYLLLTSNELFNLRVVLMDLEEAYEALMKGYDLLDSMIHVEIDLKKRSLHKQTFAIAEAYRSVLDHWIELVNKNKIQPMATPIKESL